MNHRITIALSIVLIMMGVVGQLAAQGIEIECGEDFIITDGIDIQFPNITATDSHTVTVIGLDNFDAVLATFNPQQNGGCNDNSFNASGYNLDLPTTGIAVDNEYNAQMTFQNSNFMRAVVADYDNFDGEFVLMVEGLSYDGNPDLINVIVTADMIESGLPLTAYVIEQTEGLDLSLALVDDNGVPLQDNITDPIECDNAGDVDTCWGAHLSLIGSYANISGTIDIAASDISPMLSVPLTPDDEQSIIPFQIQQSPLAEQDMTGDYIFLLHIGLGDLLIADGQATTSESDSRTNLLCDEQLQLTDAIDITLPRIDDDYFLSVVGLELENPMMAIMDNLDGGLCYLTASGDIMSADLPLVGLMQPTTSAVRANVFTESARILTGLVDDTSGGFLFTIDGRDVAFDDTPDVVSIAVTESMVASGQPVTVYMISDTLDLNPQLALVSAEGEILTDANGEFIACLDTSASNQCWGEFEDMANAEITVRNDKTVQGITRDVMLRIPLTSELIGTTLNFMSSAVDETFGKYILIIHIPTRNTVGEQE